MQMHLRDTATINKITEIRASESGTSVICGDNTYDLSPDFNGGADCAVGKYVVELDNSNLAFMDSRVVEHLFTSEPTQPTTNIEAAFNQQRSMLRDVFDAAERQLIELRATLIEGNELTPELAIAFLVNHAYRTVNHNLLATEEDMTITVSYEPGVDTLNWLMVPYGAPAYGGEFPVSGTVSDKQRRLPKPLLTMDPAASGFPAPGVLADALEQSSNRLLIDPVTTPLATGDSLRSIPAEQGVKNNDASILNADVSINGDYANPGPIRGMDSQVSAAGDVARNTDYPVIGDSEGSFYDADK